MSKKKSRKDKQKKELISYCYLAEAEMGERTKEQKNFKNYFIHLKIWKNNLDKSRENGGLGSYQLKVYVFSQWAKKAKQKEGIYLFKELR